MEAADHNRIVAQATTRAWQLEPRLARILHPILDAAGTDAARTFTRRATGALLATAAQAERERRDLAFVAAGQPRHFALTAAADGVTPRSTMVALRPTPEQAQRLAAITGADPAKLHVTLCYLGETDGDLGALAESLHRVAAGHGPMNGKVAGVGSFEDNGKGHPIIMLPSVPGLVEARVAATQALHQAGIDYSRSYGYQAHMTIGYTDAAAPADGAFAAVGEPLDFAALHVVRGDQEEIVIPLVGAKPLTADGSMCAWPGCTSVATHAVYGDCGTEHDSGIGMCQGGHTGAPPELLASAAWSAPAPDALVDVDALVAKLRTKTDPVRLAVVEAAMTPSLDAAGLDFDVANPFTAKVLAQSGSQITNIAQTTQQNVMSIISKAYDEGLSIPDTAKAIRAGMKEASLTRATLIARTELAGAVNGGSLAAAQIVSGATEGVPLYKRWLTAEGAHYPRHEDYPGLDGQTTTLDGYFEVGDAQLQHPGDPDGPPEEVCNC